MPAASGQEARRARLERVSEYLLAQRRVALTGAPGIGKTYEARRLAHAWLSVHGTPPTWVQLEAAAGADDIVTACIHATGLPGPAPSL